jgi:hypothetical protein
VSRQWKPRNVEGRRSAECLRRAVNFVIDRVFAIGN